MNDLEFPVNRRSLKMTAADLKTLFQAKLKENPDHAFHSLDLDRIKHEKYLNRVMKHCDDDHVRGLETLWEIFSWRKSVGANGINETNIRMDYVTQGVFFPRGRDIDGCLLLIVKFKRHLKSTKDFEEIKKVIIYWFDRLEREENGDQITLFFDFYGCSRDNLDMELTNYLISLFNNYYPSFLNNIIIYQMPLVLLTAFKISLPDKAVEKMKFVNRGSLKDFVTPDQALTCWGGSDDYEFQFVSEGKAFEPTPKKVTHSGEGVTHPPDKLLRLNPNNCIVFRNQNDVIIGQFTIRNLDESAVSFKIKSTSPEKFRVRPNTGILTTGSKQGILVVAQPGFQLRNTMKDTFSVVTVQIPKTDLTQKEVNEIWQNSSRSKVNDYRLKCLFPVRELPKIGNLEVKRQEQSDSVVDSLNDIQRSYELVKIEMKVYQFIIVLLTSLMVIQGFLVYQNANDGYCKRMLAFNFSGVWNHF